MSACRGKVRHGSKGSAVRALKRIGNAGLNSYPCGQCGGWHLGNSNRPHKLVARIEQLLAKPR